MGARRHAAWHVPAATSTSRAQVGAPVHVVGHAPFAPAAIAVSHVSPAAAWMTPSPHVGEQSGSVAEVQPSAQQPSRVALHVTTRVSSQRAVQSDAAPARTLSRQLDGDGGQDVRQGVGLVGPLSHDSPGSTTLLPHVAWQSLSVRRFAPFGQHPSPETLAVIGVCAHVVPQPEPVRTSRVHGSPSSHEAGQPPVAVAGNPGSQRSEPSSLPSPQAAGQSSSTACQAPAGQQPSSVEPDCVVTGTWVQTASHVPAETSASFVHGSRASQVSGEAGQAPGCPASIAVSQVSPTSTMPSPQVAEQSGSVFADAPAGQHLSPETGVVISTCVQTA